MDEDLEHKYIELQLKYENQEQLLWMVFGTCMAAMAYTLFASLLISLAMPVLAALGYFKFADRPFTKDSQSTPE